MSKISIPISDENYLGIFERARNLYMANGVMPTLENAIEIADRIIEERTGSGLQLEDSAQLLRLGLKYKEVYNSIIGRSKELRRKLFGHKVSVMAPLEYGSMCMSECIFCGWRSSNREIPRLALSEEGFKSEFEHLLKMGFSNIELVGGDNIAFLKYSLQKFLKIMSDLKTKTNPDARLSICLTPLLFEHYKVLRDVSGLEVVLTWQETYDVGTFNQHVLSGPKRFGIDINYNVVPDGNGFLARLRSQELAIQAGLQVGIGSMIGLNKEVEIDILSCLLHGRMLYDRFDGKLLPLIFGLPIWRPITTPETDLYNNRVEFSNLDELFLLTSAIYLMGMPDHYAWVFPNCRVPLDIQIEAIHVAGCFSSTEVSVAPGGYKAVGSDLGTKYKSICKGKSLEEVDLVKKGEQFTHYFSPHKSYLDRFNKEGLFVVKDRDILKDRGFICG